MPSRREQAASFEATAPQLKSYLQSVWALGPAKVLSAAGFVIFGAAVEGVGIALLVPLLALVFAKPSDPPALGPVPIAPIESLDTSVQLIILLAVFAGLMAIRGLVLWQRDLRLATLSFELVDAWRGRLIGAISQASWQQIHGRRRSHLEFAATNDVARLATASDQLLRGIAAALQFLIQVGVAFSLAPLLSVIAFGFAALALPMTMPLIRASLRYGADLTSDGKRRQTIFSDFLAGLKLAKVYDAEQRYTAEFLTLTAAMRARGLTYLNSQIWSQNAFRLIAAFVACGVVIVGFVFLGTPSTVLSAFLILLTRLIGPALQIVRGAQSLAGTLPAVGNLLAIEGDLAVDATAEAVRPVAVRPDQKPAALSFDCLSFDRPDRPGAILDRVSASLRAGECAALLGPSGSGKTTLADILIGLTEATGGSLYFDGAEIRTEHDRAALRRQVGYVPQDPFLFDDTVSANLRFARRDAEEHELWAALESAGAATFVRALPERLETRCGDRGSALSGGERQRIALARALLRKPRLLVLDEATSALDRDSERHVLETLGKLRGSVTAIVIAHRLPADAPIDWSWSLEGGKLSVTSLRATA